MTIVAYGFMVFLINLGVSRLLTVVLRTLRLGFYRLWKYVLFHRSILFLIDTGIYYRLHDPADPASTRTLFLTAMTAWLITWAFPVIRLPYLVYRKKQALAPLLKHIFIFMAIGLVMHGSSSLTALLLSSSSFSMTWASETGATIIAIATLGIFGLCLVIIMGFVFGQSGQGPAIGYVFILALELGSGALALAIGSGYYLLNLPGRGYVLGGCLLAALIWGGILFQRYR